MLEEELLDEELLDEQLLEEELEDMLLDDELLEDELLDEDNARRLMGIFWIIRLLFASKIGLPPRLLSCEQ